MDIVFVNEIENKKIETWKNAQFIPSHGSNVILGGKEYFVLYEPTFKSKDLCFLIVRCQED